MGRDERRERRRKEETSEDKGRVYINPNNPSKGFLEKVMQEVLPAAERVSAGQMEERIEQVKRKRGSS
jgi:hypothetical protein